MLIRPSVGIEERHKPVNPRQETIVRDPLQQLNVDQGESVGNGE